MRPFVTLAYAQSLDGSLARPGQRLTLSGPESLKMTHELRASHDAILIGIGTVLVDDPQLTVRLVAGSHPQPVILDSHLRMPATAALWAHPDKRPWLAATDPPPDRQTELEAAGAQVLCLPQTAAGRVELIALLEKLSHKGVKRLMVEGGASVINAFLEQRLVDRLIVTIAPRLVGGLKAVDKLARTLNLPDAAIRRLGADLVVEANLT